MCRIVRFGLSSSLTIATILQLLALINGEGLVVKLMTEAVVLLILIAVIPSIEIAGTAFTFIHPPLLDAATTLIEAGFINEGLVILLAESIVLAAKAYEGI